MRWVVMQSMKYKKWVLAVMNESCTAYEVTEIMSENPEKIIQYAEYMNEGKWETKLDDTLEGIENNSSLLYGIEKKSISKPYNKHK